MIVTSPSSIKSPSDSLNLHTLRLAHAFQTYQHLKESSHNSPLHPPGSSRRQHQYAILPQSARPSKQAMPKKAKRSVKQTYPISSTTSTMPSAQNSDTPNDRTADVKLPGNKQMDNMVLGDDQYFQGRLRQMQGTYDVKHYHCSDKGYCFQIQLVWDHNRLWGKFQFEYFKGVFLVDPAPDQDHSWANDGKRQLKGKQEPDYYCEPKSATWEYPFVWRGTSTLHPDVLNFPSKVGKIRFGFRDISGHFDGMLGMDLQGDRCEFHGKQSTKDALVPFTIQDMIGEWEEHRTSSQEELCRLSSGHEEVKADENTEPEVKPSSSVTKAME